MSNVRPNMQRMFQASGASGCRFEKYGIQTLEAMGRSPWARLVQTMLAVSPGLNKTTCV